jgi:hypothetical protein
VGAQRDAQAASYPEGYRLGALSCGHLGSIFAGAHRELSVALVQSHGYVYHSCLLLHAMSAGRQVLPGVGTPFLG